MKFLNSLIILPLILGLVACGGGGGSNGTPSSAGPAPAQTPTKITGAWVYIYPHNQCRETFFYNEDGTFELNSNEEVITGTYTFQDGASSDNRRLLHINILTDNLLSNCVGENEDDTQYYIEAYIDIISGSEIAWYSDPTGGDVLATMTAFSGAPTSIRSQISAGEDIRAFEESNLTILGSSSLNNISSVGWYQETGPTLSISDNSQFELNITLPSIEADTTITLRLDVILQDQTLISDTIDISLLDHIDIADLIIDDAVLANCIDQTAQSLSVVEVSDITSLSCSGVASINGLENFLNLSVLHLPANSLSTLSILFELDNLQELDISGNENFNCQQIDLLSTKIGSVNITVDELCLTGSVGVELSAIGFDSVVDEARDQIYISIPSRNEIAVISISKLRVVDRIQLSAPPNGIDLSIDGTRLFVALNGVTSIASIDIDQRDVSLISLADKTGHFSTYDVIEGAPDRLFVSASPDSSGFAYIAQIDLAAFNLVSRVADNRIIRAIPKFIRSPDYSVVYLSEGFSPNSLYKLDLNDPDAGIILEDEHGAVGFTSIKSVNPTGTRIALGSGQILRTGSFIEEGSVISGVSSASQISDTLFVFGSDSAIESFNFTTLESINSIPTGCTYGATSVMSPFNNDRSFMLLQDDIICLHGLIQRDVSADIYPDLHFLDLGLEECVIETAIISGYTQPEEIESLDCSSFSKNIISLEGIERLVNLRYLDLSSHSVFSLTPLQGLSNLQTFVAQNSVLSTLEPLGGINSLLSIDISGNDMVSCNELTQFTINLVGIIADECNQDVKIELGGLGADMEYDRLNNKLYVSIPSAQKITEIDINTGTIINNFSLPGEPKGIDLSNDLTSIYSTLYGDGDIAYVDLSSGLYEIVDISTELGDETTWDVAEISSNRIIVSANPGSGGIAYIVEVRRDLDNTVSRVASDNIIRAEPTFATMFDSSAVYVGEGFSPNSLYKLDVNDPALPIILEDQHGNVGGTNNLTLNSDGSLIYLRSGQVLSTDTFDQVKVFPSGLSWLSNDGSILFIAEGESDAVGLYDVNTSIKVGRQEWGCDISDVKILKEFQNGGIIVMGDDLVCFTRTIPFN